MALLIDNTAEVTTQLETVAVVTSSTISTADSAPTGAAGVDTSNVSFITLGARNFVAATAATIQVWGLVGVEWAQADLFTVFGPLLMGPLGVRGFDRVFAQVTSLTGTSVDLAYMVHTTVAPVVAETRPEAFSLQNSSLSPAPAPAAFQVAVPYTSSSFGESVDYASGLTPVLTVPMEDTGEDGDDVTTGFSLTASNTPVVSGFAGMITVIATVSAAEVTMLDDGAGNLTGSAGTGTVTSYPAGTMSVTFSTAPDNLTDIFVTYTYEV